MRELGPRVNRLLVSWWRRETGGVPQEEEDPVEMRTMDGQGELNINVIEASQEEPTPSSTDAPQGVSQGVPQGSLSVWNDLPATLRNDPSFLRLREACERYLRTSRNPDRRSRGSVSGRLQVGAVTPDPGQGPSRTRDFLSVNVVTAAASRRSSLTNRGKGPLFSHPLDEDTDDMDNSVFEPNPPASKAWIRGIKIFFLLGLWLLFTTILITQQEKVTNFHQISIPEGQTRSYWILENPKKNQILVTLEGAFIPAFYRNMSTRWLTVWLEMVVPRKSKRVVMNMTSFTEDDFIFAKNISEMWLVPLVSEEMIDYVPEMKYEKTFDLDSIDITAIPRALLRLQLRSNMNISFPVAMMFDLAPINMNDGIIYAAVVLCGLYVLIIFEVVHRTLAAMVASTMSLAILAALDERPTMAELVSWIDVETLLLLFSMMVLVAILSETGIFDYLAVLAYRITGGRIWPLVNTLCFFTAVLSSVLDNVTTVLLMTPVTIRLCEVMGMNPVPILMAMIIYSNIGGATTPVGDPPNVITASNTDVINAGVDFGVFTLHMGVGVVLVFIVTHIHLRLIYRNIGDFGYREPHEVQELKHEIAIWQRTAASLSSYSKDEDVLRETLLKKTRRLLGELKRKVVTGSIAQENYKTNLEELQEKYPIRDRLLLIKSGITLAFVVSLFFMHSIPGLNLSLGWTALLGAILLLLLADNEDMEGVLARVEWGTLLFFAALFILMESLSRLGLIDWIGRQTESVILSVSKESRLAVAILLILWVSAVASAFVDNIPLTTMMVRIITSLAKKPELGLPLQPLVWALSFGACLGGNGTLIGASANVVCAGVAEQHGYRFTFMQYFKVGFPVMIQSMVVISVYLMISHVAVSWH